MTFFIYFSNFVWFGFAAIWLLPRDWVYGDWPRSGEIDMMESRGTYLYIKLGARVLLSHQITFKDYYYAGESQRVPIQYMYDFRKHLHELWVSGT